MKLFEVEVHEPKWGKQRKGWARSFAVMAEDEAAAEAKVREQERWCWAGVPADVKITVFVFDRSTDVIHLHTRRAR